MGICVASMIGSGIFLVPGEIGPSLGTPANVLIAWTIGGLLALCGGFIVAEIATHKPSAGAVYRTVHDTLGPGAGYLFGTVSVFVGYFASLSVVALTAAGYISHFLPAIDVRLLATIVIIVPAVVHGTRVMAGTLLNDVLVALKLGIIAVFVVAGLGSNLETVMPSPDVAPADAPEPPGPISASMGAAVVRISFAYLGWAAVNVVAGEVRRPGRNLPLAVLGSVALVTIAYLLINIVFMQAVAPAAMVNAAGEPLSDIGAVAARMIFGEAGGDIVSLAIIALVVSTAATMLFTGSRLLLAMSWKGELPAPLGRLNAAGAPGRSVLIYAAVGIALLWSVPVGALLDYAGVLTTCCAAMMGVALLVLRRRKSKQPFSMPLYPLPVVVFLGLTTWLLASTVLEDPLVAVASVGTIMIVMLVRPLLTRPVADPSDTYTDEQRKQRRS